MKDGRTHKLKYYVLWIMHVIRWTFILFFGSSVFFVLLYRWVPVPCSPLMFIRLGQQVIHGESPKLKHQWVDADSISKELPLAVWASEDQNFFNHNGFDFAQIKIALKESSEGKRERGASTISQQTAKNVFLWPSHSWMRKGLEVYFTILIETFWSKERIMEVYLNTIEMGDGIYGAEAVALEHFGVPARRLTRNQCALIAVSLPNPRRMNSANPTSYMRRRQSWVLQQMRWLGPYPPKE